MAQKQYVDYNGLKYYDEKIKAHLAAADEVALQAAKDYAKDYADGLADNYDAAGVAQSKMEELRDGQVKTNKEAIEAINNAETGILKQAKDYADGKDGAIAAAKKAGDDAQADVDALEKRVEAVEGDVGELETLETTNKDDLVSAINEVRNAVSVGGTNAVVTIATDTTTEGALKSYTIKQGENTVGVIDIPKDMVVESGEVVVDPEGQEKGTYIKLVLANVTEPLYINVGHLVDIYKAKEGAAQVQVAIDASTREISATIVAGSIGATELADNAVVTAKIADGNVTKAKLSTAVQGSLDKADSAVQTIAEGTANGTVKVDGTDVAVHGLGSAAFTEASAYDVAGAAAGVQGKLDEEVERAKAAEAKALEDAQGYADGLNTAMNTRVEALEAIDHDHANKAELDLIVAGDKAKWDAAEAKAHEHENKAVIDGITSEKVAAWDAAEGNAKAYVDEKVAGVDLSGIATNATAIEGLQGKMTTAEGKITALEEKVGDGFVAVTNGEIDTLFAAQA